MNMGLFADFRDNPEPPVMRDPDPVVRPRDVTPVGVPAPNLLDPDAIAEAITAAFMTKEDQRRMAETVGRASLGNGLGATPVLLLSAGLLDLAGVTDYEEERDKAFAKRRAGVRDGSLRIPGTSIRILIT